MPVTTTHDPDGGGRPRLIFAMGGATQTGDAQREFDLRPGLTTIGSAPDADLVLDGIDPRQAEIRRDDADDYVFMHVGTATASSVDGRPADSIVLHTGNRIEVGDWVFSYYREEFADHGRPYGGRLGGSEEGSLQQPQPEPEPRGSTDGTGLQYT